MYYRYRALITDLVKKEFVIKNLNQELVKKTLGGCAPGAALMYRLAQEVKDPFDEDNIIIMTLGALTGTPVPTESKTAFFTISPLSGGWLESISGGSIAVSCEAVVLRLCLSRERAITSAL